MQRGRQNNIELCRVCVMLFIVIHHCIVSGLGLNETLNDGGENFSSATICLIIMNAFVIVSVNVFFLISGYFGIKLRTQKIKKLLEEVLFYSVAIYAVCVLLGAEKLTLKNILKYTILSINNYWFVIVYLALMFISPALNYAVDYLKENNCEVQGLGIMFFCLCVYGYVFSNGFSEYIGINNGYSLIFASFLYITGRVINEKEAVIKKRMDFSRSAIGYITSSIIISGGGILLVYYKRGTLAWKLYSYNEPLVYISSLCFFIIFLNCASQGKMARFLGKLGKDVFGVYLIHTMPLIRPYRYFIAKWLTEKSRVAMFPIIISAYCMILFAVCLLISHIRNRFVGRSKI